MLTRCKRCQALCFETESLLLGHDAPYNSATAVAPLAYNEDHLSGRGPSLIRVLGQLHRRLGPALAPAQADLPDRVIARWSNAEGVQPLSNVSYAQVYYYSPADATELRMTHPINKELHKKLLYELGTLLRETHPYVRSFVAMHETIKKAKEKGESIAAILVGPSGSSDDFGKRMIVVQPRHLNPNEPPLKHFHRYHHQADPMIYVLMFPYADPGWIMGVCHSNEPI